MRKILITTMLVLFSVSSQAQILYKISGKGLKEASYIVGTFHTVKATYSFQAKTIFQGKTLERQKEGLMCMVDNPDFTDEMVATVTKAYYAQDLDAIKDAIDTKMHNSCDATPALTSQGNCMLKRVR